MRSTFRLLAAALLVACGGGSNGDDDDDVVVDPDAGVSATMVFTPPSGGTGAGWGAIPYPSDLFLDGSGRLTLTGLPTGPNADDGMIGLMTEALHELDGAGVTTGVYFPVDGDVDPADLAGNVHLVDVDDGLAAIPVDLVWRDDLDVIVAVPQRGTVLREAHRYGAYVTRGAGVAPAQRFLEAIDLASVPSDPGAAAAQQTLRPLVEALDGATVDQLAVATVFTTQHVTAEMKALRDAVAAAPPTVSVEQVVGPAAGELDALFGAQDPAAEPGFAHAGYRAQPHGNIAAVVHGQIQLPSFLNAAPRTAGRIAFDGSGAPQLRGTHSVRYTLTLPVVSTSYADTPVAIYVHGINRTRIDMLTQADTAAAQGIALLAIDVEYHGDRSSNYADVRNDLTGVMAPDGFGDLEGLFPAVEFFHLLPSGGVPAYHPGMMRDNLRQAAAEISALAAFVTGGDPAPLNAALGSAGLPSDLSFRGDVGLISESFGGMLSVVALAVEPNIDVAVITSCAAGFPYPTMLHSANFSGTFSGVVLDPFDVTTRTVLGDATRGARYEPMVMLYNTAIERGDPIAFAPALADDSVRGDGGPNLILSASWEDEWVPNEATESLMGAVGVSRVATTSPETPPGAWTRFVDLPEVSAPVTANRAGGQRTVAGFVLYKAGHAFLRKIDDLWEYEPEFPPFVERAEPLIFDNPIGEFHAVWGSFFADFFAGTVPTIEDPYAN